MNRPAPLLRPRPITAADLPGLLAVQHACYGADFHESADVYARRMAHPAQCSLALEGTGAGPMGALLAYLAAYAGTAGRVTVLNADFDTTPQPNALVLHDLAVLPHCSGLGIAQTLLRHSWSAAAARGLQRSALVSVQGSQHFWERQGYKARRLEDAEQQQRLAAYGDGAVYMERALAKA